MAWTENVSELFEPLREIAEYHSDKIVASVFREGQADLVESDYDNWNGGTTYYTLTIQVPPYVYASLEDDLEEVEKKILERVKKYQRAETHDYVSQVIIRPGRNSSQRVIPVADTPFWLPGHFRLFISHLSVEKERATKLKNQLTSYAISSFVAHEDIQPTKEWQVEIEKGLFTMDGLVALLTPDFHASDWKDQEVGVALGRDIAIFPLRVGIDPYGLMGKYQGIQAMGRTLGDVAASIAHTILVNSRTRSKYITCLVEQLLASQFPKDATPKLAALENAEEIPADQLTRLREQTASNSALHNDASSLRRINAILEKHGWTPVVSKTQPPVATTVEDDIPF